MVPATTAKACPSTELRHLTARSTMPLVRAFCNRHGLPHYESGKWMWVAFPTAPPLDVVELLRRNGFVWSNRRQAWFHPAGSYCYKLAGSRGKARSGVA